MKHLFYLATLFIMSMNNVFAQNATETTKATVSQDSLNFETIEITMDKSIEGYITSPKGDYYGYRELPQVKSQINTHKTIGKKNHLIHFSDRFISGD